MTEPTAGKHAADPNEFDAGEAFAPLRYNFEITDKVTGEVLRPGPKGIIPEPSHGKVSKFRRVIGEQIEKAMADMPQEDIEKMSDSDKVRLLVRSFTQDDTAQHSATITAMSEITTISRTVLEAQPYRIQQAFLGYLAGLFLTPTTSLSGMSG